MQEDETITDEKPSNSKRKLTNNHNLNDSIEDSSTKKLRTSAPPRVNSSPKKRLDLENDLTHSSPNKVKKNKFIYGNYSRYYGYRTTDHQHDVRLDVFAEHKELFKDAEILDIGCNTGLITTAISKQFPIKSIIGIDIDKSLINKARNFIQKSRKNFKNSREERGESSNSDQRKEKGFPFNINFIHGNYVLRDNILLEIEYPQFDLILCLSVTKWIHLNFGDDGLKQAFRRMCLQLRPGGKLILEPQSWDGYKRRKKLTEEIFKNYKSIKFFPKDFNDYLLGPEVGFSEMYELKVPDNDQKGFKRPIYVFVKKRSE